ncbi:MAG: hypothetical protein H6704_02520 [Myxococcales bacterium]|nr:hypothetical protein [Myxococcales bacterium]
MKGSGWVVAAAWLAAAPAAADVGEASLRPHYELRVGPTAAPDGDVGDARAHHGAGALFGFGLSFSWTLTARYAFASAGEQQQTEASGEVQVWRADRHALLVGAAWAPWDELTPVLSAEAGVTLRVAADRALRRPDLDSGALGLAGTPDAAVDAVPTARLGAAFEWRFTDFWSLAPGAFVEYADGLGGGAQLWLAGYAYL